MSSTVIIQEPVKPQVTIKDGDNVVRVETVIPGEGTGSGAGDVLKSGAPTANQTAVWTGASAIRGSATHGVNDTTGVVSLALGASNNALATWSNVASRVTLTSTVVGQGIDINVTDPVGSIGLQVAGANAAVFKAAQVELTAASHEVFFSGAGTATLRSAGTSLDLRNLTATVSLEDDGAGNPRLFPATGTPNLNIGKAGSTNAVDLRADVRVECRAANVSVAVESFRIALAGSVPLVFTSPSGARIDVPSAADFKITLGGIDRVTLGATETTIASTGAGYVVVDADAGGVRLRSPPGRIKLQANSVTFMESISTSNTNQYSANTHDFLGSIPNVSLATLTAAGFEFQGDANAPLVKNVSGVTAPVFVPNKALPTTGIGNVGASNTLGFFTTGVQRMTIDNAVISSGIIHRFNSHVQGSSLGTPLRVGTGTEVTITGNESLFVTDEFEVTNASYLAGGVVAGGTATIDAGMGVDVQGTKAIGVPSLTTTERDALTGVDRMFIYNETTGKFQGRAGGAWVDFH